MQDPATPGAGDHLDLKALFGELLHITVAEIVRDIQTVHGVSDAIRANVTVLSGASKGDTLTDVLIFPRVLRSQLETAVGANDPVVLGRLGQGAAKPGKSAPWVLNAPSDEDRTTAGKYEAHAAINAADQAAPF